MMKQITALFLFLFGIFFYTPVSAALVTQYNWTTGVLDSDHAAGAGQIRNTAGVSKINRLVYSYITNDGLNVFFATSTPGGDSWSEPQFVTSTPADNPFVLPREVPTTLVSSTQDLMIVRQQYSSTSYGIAYGPYAGAFASTTHAYTSLGYYSDLDVMLDDVDLDFFGLTVIGTHEYSGVNFIKTASSTGNYMSDSFNTHIINTDYDSSITVLSDAEYLAGSIYQTSGVFSYIASDAPTLHTYMGDIPFERLTPVTSGLASGGAGTPVAFEIERYNALGIAFILCGGARGSSCDLYFSSIDYGNGLVADAEIIFSGIPQSDNIKLSIASRNKGPVIVFSDGSNIRYAAREYNNRTGNGACTGATVSDWSCGIVQSGVTTVSALNVGGMRYNGSPSGLYEDQIGLVWSDNSQTYYAQGIPTDVTLAAATAGSAFPKPVVPKNPRIVVNNGVTETRERIVPISARAEDATYVALSLNSDFYNVPWQEIGYPNYITLPNTAGNYTIYAKFTNQTGGVSEVITSGISFLKDVVTAPAKPIVEESAPPIQTPVQIPEPVIQSAPLFSLPVIPPTPITYSKYSCTFRPNAFSLGGKIIRDSTSKKLYMISESQKSACEVVSAAVARSWGVVTFPTRSISGYELSTPLPYKPGTVIVDSKTGTRYFANSAGELHKFPSLTQYRALGYSSQAFHYDTAAAITRFNRSADLTRRDIHPDGTMFVLDKKKGEYAILHNRALHRLTAVSIKKYGEQAQRATSLLKGETYLEGDRWDF